MKRVMNKMSNKVREVMSKKRLGGSKAIIVEVILLLLAVSAVLLYKTNLVDMVRQVVEDCKTQLTSIIS